MLHITVKYKSSQDKDATLNATPPICWLQTWPYWDDTRSFFFRKWNCGIRTIINKCSRSFMHIKTDMINVLCICVFMPFLIQDRMISMTLDKDNEVALQTMKLLILISRWVVLSWFSKHAAYNFFWQELTSFSSDAMMTYWLLRTISSSFSLFTHHSAPLRPLQESWSSQGI